MTTMMPPPEKSHLAPEPDDTVLSTLNPDGSRHWIRPRVSPGRFLDRRRIVAYGLIALFAGLPYLRIGGKPAILLDVAAREFTFVGVTFFATDTILLALAMVSVLIGIFLVTALLGRAWCGWACPQTVYMEFLFRPIERLFDGPPHRGGRPGTKKTPLRTVGKYATYFLVSFFLAHTFLAYFVGVEALAEWVRRSPFEHPASFLIIAVTTALMMFHFSYFREQLCIVACPYGRLQSALLDRDSLIVSYDPNRGEPRGKHRKADTENRLGDCVDCHLCVETCPTGIDIREGLKMECVHCAQCIDACDEVMDKIGKPRGLIRYSSQSRIAGEKPRWLRPRVILYPLAMTVLLTAFGLALASKSDADVRLLRSPGMPYTVMPDQSVSNPVRVKVTNRLETPASYTLSLVDAPDGARIVLNENPFVVEPGESRTLPFVLSAPRSAFTKGGGIEIVVRIEDGAELSKDLPYRILGPAGRATDEGGSR